MGLVRVIQVKRLMLVRAIVVLEGNIVVKIVFFVAWPRMYKLTMDSLRVTVMANIAFNVNCFRILFALEFLFHHFIAVLFYPMYHICSDSFAQHWY